jgi:predicted neutral ceramidase superfamily lipid hydrolase
MNNFVTTATKTEHFGIIVKIQIKMYMASYKLAIFSSVVVIQLTLAVKQVLYISNPTLEFNFYCA